MDPAPERAAVETEPLFSATTLRDFSKTFQSLIVLSAEGEETKTSAGCRTWRLRAWRYCSSEVAVSDTFSMSPSPHARSNKPGRTIGRQQEMCCVLSLAPPDLVDLLLDLQALEIVEFGLVALELGVELVLARALLGLVALEEDDAAALVARREVVSSVVKLNGRCAKKIGLSASYSNGHGRRGAYR